MNTLNWFNESSLLLIYKCIFFATAVVFTSCETSNVRISSSLYLQSCFHDFIIVNIMLYTNRYIVNIWNFRLLKGILWLYYYTIFKVFFSLFYCREYKVSELERCPCVCARARVRVCVCVWEERIVQSHLSDCGSLYYGWTLRVSQISFQSSNRMRALEWVMLPALTV